MVVERIVFIDVKLKNFIEKSIVIMLAWVVDLMWKSLMSYIVGLLYYDNLIKCGSCLFLDMVENNISYIIWAAILNL